MSKADRLLKRLDKLLAADRDREGLKIVLDDGRYLVMGAVPSNANGFYDADGTRVDEETWRLLES